MDAEWEGSVVARGELASAPVGMGDGALAWYKVVGIELGLLGAILAPLVCGVLLAR